jgi:hypothetical protein
MKPVALVCKSSMPPIAVAFPMLHFIFNSNSQEISMKRFLFLGSVCISLAVCAAPFTFQSTQSLAQEKSPPEKGASKNPIAEFEEYLSDSKLTGSFTIDGKPLDKLEAETYEIKTAKKLDGYDSLWEIVARIKYGNKDVEVPVEINVEWIGKTPVMVMDSMALPGLGTFSARVVFHDKKYAGTWKHDDVGGHLFGRVEKKVAK